MGFEWDEDTSSACFRERGFSFDFVAQVFFDSERFVEPDSRGSYGEDRYRAMGRIDGRVYVVIYTPRGRAIRLISARKANKREVLRYENSTRQD